MKVTLVSGDQYTAYSGFLPGVIAGIIPRKKLLLDVPAIAAKFGARLEQCNMVDIKPKLRKIVLESGTSISYDCLSINIGGTCEQVISEEGGDVMPVKPVAPFLDWLDNWSDTKRTTVAVIGGGVSGAEVALSIDARLRQDKREGGVYLVGGNPDLVPLRPKLAKSVEKQFMKRGISQILGAQGTTAYPGYVKLSNGVEYLADHVIVSTGVKPWAGFKQTGFELDEDGFILVNSFLESVSHPDVFACGDCASIAGTKTQKSGVNAVRQANTLAYNIIARMTAKPLHKWKIEKKSLAILCWWKS